MEITFPNPTDSPGFQLLIIDGYVNYHLAENRFTVNNQVI